MFAVLQIFLNEKNLIRVVFAFLQTLKLKKVIILSDPLATIDDVYTEFRNVSKNFGKFTAVNNVSFKLHRGEILGFLGPNGAGKSTTMKMMANLLRPSAGEVWIRANGHLEELTTRSKDRLLDNLGFLIENPSFYEAITPREILSYFAELKGYPAGSTRKRVETVMDMLDLGEWIDVKIGKFSKGMRQKVGILSAIVHDPDIIVLDEPYTGLDPIARKQVRDFILELKGQNKTVFISSHLLFEISEIADRVAIIANGKIVAMDTLDNLEQANKNSMIHVEIFNHQSQAKEEIVRELSQIVGPLTGLHNASDFLTYQSEGNHFEIRFNGDPATQKVILKALIIGGIEITDFSVPKADLLEDLYVQYVDPNFIQPDNTPVAEVLN
jgi:ABC-2 type transport system ATP-binding protein